MTDLFPAFSLGGVALLNLMRRLEPPAPVRWSIVAALGLLLVLHLTDQIHLFLPERIGMPAYFLLICAFSTIIVWNWLDKRAAGRP